MVSMIKGKKFTNNVFLVILIILAVVSLFPVVWVALSSFKPQNELFSSPMTFFPKTWTLSNYASAISQGNFARYFLNTVFVACTSTVITVLINIMAGYALAKYYFRGRDVIFGLMIATLMVPLQVIMIPIFLQLKNLGMLNSLWGIIIPPAATPTGIFLARQYMVNPEPIQAALDLFGTLLDEMEQLKIIGPYQGAKPRQVLITRQQWIEMTMQQALANFVGQLQINWSNLLAMTTISIIPVLIVFFSFQKFFMSGITAGSVKG